MKYLYLVLVLVITSCNLDTPEPEIPQDFRAENEAQIVAYLAENNLVAQKTATGLHYIIENQGEGEKPTATSNVTVAYKGYFLNGTVFDESTSTGIAVDLDKVIAGWTEGIPLFNVGGKGVLLIPAHLGYGSFDYNIVPGGSVLVFDVEVLAINP